MAQLQSTAVTGSLTTTGNVGVGTVAAPFKQTIYDSAAAATVYQTSGTGAGLSNGFYVGHTGNISYIWNYNNFPLAIGTNSTERVRITEGGNVGIGVTNPTAGLEIDGNSVAQNLILRSRTGTDFANITFTDDTGATQLIAVGNASGNLRFLVGSGLPERMRITSGGNVGLGTSVATDRLYIKNTTGDAGIVLDNGTQVLRFDQNSIRTTTASQIAIFTNNTLTNGIYINSSGNVGVGTATPSYKLDSWGGNARFVAAAGTDALFRIIASNYATEADSRLFLGENDTLGMTLEYDGQNNIGYVGMNDSVDPTGAYSKRIQMSRGGTEVAFMAGNVGVGVATPISKLDVNGSIQAGSGNTFGSGVDGASIYMSPTSGVGLSGNLSGYSRNLIKTDGTSVIEIGQPDTSLISAVNISAGDATGVIALKTGGNNTRLYINSGGNVGVGTANPNLKFHVTGQSVFGDNNTLAVRSDAFVTVRAAAFAGIDVTSLRTSGNIGGLRGIDSSGTTKGQLLLKVDGGFEYFSGASLFNILPSGNVGIGITTPENRLHLGPNSGNVKLALEWSDSHSATSGEAYSTIYTSGQGGSYPFSGRGNLILQPRNNDTNGFGDLVIMTGATATPKLVVQAGGNVGIGIANPTGKLHVDSGLAHNTVKLTTGVSGGTGYDVSLFLNGGANNSEMSLNMGIIGNEDRDRIRTYQGNMYFRTNDSENMILNSSGNVGIGTAVPTSLLHVYQAASGVTPYPLTGGINIDSNSITGINIMSPDTGYGRIYFGAPTGGSTSGAVEYIHNANVSTGYMKLRAGAVDRVFILGNGNVGIGTINPDTKLHIWNGASGGAPYHEGITIENSGRASLNLLAGAANDSYVFFGNSTAGNAAYIGYENTARRLVLRSSDYVSLLDSTGEVVRIIGSNVGIGITTPAAKLDVQGKVRVNTTTAVPSAASMIIGGVQNAGSSAMLQIGGFVRMGYFLGIHDQSDSNNSFGITYNSNGLTLNREGGSLSGNILLATTAGNVGINNTSPQFKLHVLGTTGGDSTFNEGILIENNNATDGEPTLAFKVKSMTDGTYWFTGLNQSANYDIAYGSSFSNAGTIMRVTNTGNVGIGTVTPSRKLEVLEGNVQVVANFQNTSTVSSRIKFVDANTGAENVNIGATGTKLAMWTNNTVRMTIISGGNVGIGTTNPTHLLHVNGTLRVDDPGTGPPTSEGPPPEQYIGSSDFWLGKPDGFLAINVSGTDYVIPLYSPG